jgi:GPH family glycoside/pentoside/hexuronide:cation symporter
MNKNMSAGTKLSYFQVFAFASPSLALMLLISPIGLLPSIFAKYYGLSLVGLGAVLLFIRVFDSITDVLVGYFSDRYRLRHGTRKPFVVAGGLLALPCAYFLVNPPGGEVTELSYALGSMSFYLCYTLFNIPKFTWAGELTMDPRERTLIFSVLAFVARFSGLLFFVIPFLPLFDTQAITPEVLNFSIITGICLMLPTLLLMIKFAPDGLPPSCKEVEARSHSAAFRGYVAVFKMNKPFQLFAGAFGLAGLGLGLWGGLLFMYVDVFLGLSELYAKMAIVGFVASLLLAPIAYKLAIGLGKRNSWVLSTVFIIGGMFYGSLLSPGEAGLADLIALQMIFLIGSTFLAIISPAMLSDTVDYGSLKIENGARGVYFALFTFVLKIETALGVSLGLALAGWLGFDATAAQQSDDGIFAIRFTMCWLPMFISFLSLYFIVKTPLNEARMKIIGRRLVARSAK